MGAGRGARIGRVDHGREGRSRFRRRRAPPEHAKEPEATGLPMPTDRREEGMNSAPFRAVIGAIRGRGICCAGCRAGTASLKQQAPPTGAGNETAPRSLWQRFGGFWGLEKRERERENSLRDLGWGLSLSVWNDASGRPGKRPDRPRKGRTPGILTDAARGSSRPICVPLAPHVAPKTEPRFALGALRCRTCPGRRRRPTRERFAG